MLLANPKSLNIRAASKYVCMRLWYARKQKMVPASQEATLDGHGICVARMLRLFGFASSIRMFWQCWVGRGLWSRAVYVYAMDVHGGGCGGAARARCIGSGHRRCGVTAQLELIFFCPVHTLTTLRNVISTHLLEVFIPDGTQDDASSWAPVSSEAPSH